MQKKHIQGFQQQIHLKYINMPPKSL